MASQAHASDENARAVSSIQLPGFGGIPVNTFPELILHHPPVGADPEEVRYYEANGHKTKIDRFPNAIMDWKAEALTLREREMLSVVDRLSDKPEWRTKVFDEAIVEKWRQEAPKGWSDGTFDYCIAELRDKALQNLETGMVLVYDANATVAKSDSSISLELQTSLQKAAATLEDVPDHKKDWHPNSDEKVLDLVHPSLFPLVYGRSRILPTGTVGLSDCAKSCGEGVTIPVPGDDEIKLPVNYEPSYGEPRIVVFSREFQWLPCDVSFCPPSLTGGKDGNVKIQSYINNLHPTGHEELYTVIEAIIGKSVPFWNAVLQQSINKPIIRLDAGRGGENDDNYAYPQGKRRPRPVPDGQDGEQQEGTETSADDIDEDEETEADWRDADDWKRSTRILMQPEPTPYKSPPAPPVAHQVNLRSQFSESGLQVIVKLANIHLTPSNPSYEGGSWHIEGMLNEHICATSLYYYDVDNITDSHLAFRESVDAMNMTMLPAQHEYDWVLDMYGIGDTDGEPAIQSVGSILTREGRLLAFPNVMQHRVSPFRLSDPTKPGHRKILALFLVDPHIRVISTANVPPQQRDWWAQEARQGESRLTNLPPEIFDQVIESVDSLPIDMKEAKEIRLRLMEERKAWVDSENQEMEAETYGFCEH